MRYSIVVSLIYIVFFSSKAEAQDHCQQHFDALENIRTIMRAGYKEPHGEYLRNREREIKEDIRLCKKSKPKSTKTYNYITQKETHKKKLQSIHVPNKDQLGRQALIIKGLFEGKKQQAWLDHYQRPDECRSPETSSQFAKCINHRDEAAEKFSANWNRMITTTNTNIPKQSNLGSQNANQQKASTFNIGTCKFWTEKYKQNPKNLDARDLMEQACHNVN
ncbi:hypothetical protein E2K93_06840 [Thalassotalea sp. HSM 43]|uniref:hypothetical protein n=1 Tax=Thalassotalea sp. HSM 43 TaxID=2552945 RepID=UPI00108124B9|nr:hypothetical protein [Thalassotalea sp. HSM 43]QBY04116.1 hypothetical protein E2K93_06840 [Thalassotalea sp. HSM 43]